MDTEHKQQETPVKKPKRYFSYNGDGWELFKITLVNSLLSALTLGFYYPWAKAKLLSYHYSETEFIGSRFSFHGTGKEMFKGFIKAILIFGGIIGGMIAVNLLMQNAIINGESVIAYMLIYFGLYFLFLALIPLAIVGSAKYRAARSSFRGIHFKYIGTKKTMIGIFLKGIFLSIITFGIYAHWFQANIFRELAKNTRLGNIKFRFDGSGGDLFALRLVDGLLMGITFGIYAFKHQSNLHQYYFNNLKLEQGELRGTLEAETTGMGYFKLIFINGLIVIFTLGLGTPWALIRHMKYIAETTRFKGKIDFDNIEQGEIDPTDATDEGIFDMLDIDIA